MTNNKTQRGWGIAKGLPFWARIITYLMYTVFYPVTILLRLVLFGRITDKETPVDRLRDRFN